VEELHDVDKVVQNHENVDLSEQDHKVLSILLKGVLVGLLKKTVVDQRIDEMVPKAEVEKRTKEGLLCVEEEHNDPLLFDHGDLTLFPFEFMDP
jgi:hypothetical protein